MNESYAYLLLKTFGIIIMQLLLIVSKFVMKK